MYSVHWSARALCASSMALGILSVSSATSQYQALTQLNDALSVRMWLSYGKPTRIQITRSITDGSWTRRNVNKYSGYSPFDQFPLESSITALKVVSLPRYLLNVAVILFLLGFGLHYLFLWRENTEDVGIPSRNVFLIFFMTTGTIGLYFISLMSFRSDDEQKRSNDFSVARHRDSIEKSLAVRQLQDDLKKCQELLAQLTSQDQRAARTPTSNVHTVPQSRTPSTCSGATQVPPV